MEYIVSDVSNYKFVIEYLLEEQIGLGELPFSKMNKSGVGVCHYFLHNTCNLGAKCPLRHIKGDRTVVCKHWLRGLCKKGDDCEFLHEYDMNKMPECYFFSKYGECQNKECPFLHIDPSSKIQDCQWYDRGFCRNGPHCKNRHVRQISCKNYINGFCPDGRECQYAHPKWWPLPGYDQQEQHKQRWVCHHCNERGHKIQFCLKLSPEKRLRIQEELQLKYAATTSSNNTTCLDPTELNNQHNYNNNHNNNNNKQFIFKVPHNYKNIGNNNNNNNTNTTRTLDEITCYKCGDKGHYANRCNKGYLAFLSKSAVCNMEN